MFITINRQNIVRMFLVLSIVFIDLAQAHAVSQPYTTSPVYNFDPVKNSYSYVLNQPVDNLPSGAITINEGGMTYNYYKGVFYQENTRVQKYVIVPPPIGAVIDSIPPGYQMMVIGKTTYYEYNGIYFKRILDGYKVIEPPDSF